MLIIEMLIFFIILVNNDFIHFSNMNSYAEYFNYN